MPRSSFLIATCGECGEETPVVDTYWPATRHDPADGQLSPEECPKCGTPFDNDTKYVEDEPPEPMRGDPVSRPGSGDGSVHHR